MQEGLHYSDIFLIPKRCIVESRKECSTEVILGNRKFSMPVIPANMKSVINDDTYLYLTSKENNYFAIMHRFGVNLSRFYEKMTELGRYTSVSIGVNEDSYEQLKELKNNKYKIDYFTLDIANAWSEKAELMAKFIKDNFPESFLIVGNLATGEACEDVDSWGLADCLKVGISGGRSCITKNKTGFHVPMVTSVMDCCLSNVNIPIIADGGIVDHADIAKSLALGAHMVMAGGLFSGYDQSAGDVIEINGRLYKEYYGSASEHNKGEYKNVEGKKIMIDYKGNMDKLLKELKEDLQSSISYAGGKDLSALKNVKFIKVK